MRRHSPRWSACLASRLGLESEPLHRTLWRIGEARKFDAHERPAAFSGSSPNMGNAARAAGRPLERERCSRLNPCRCVCGDAPLAKLFSCIPSYARRKRGGFLCTSPLAVSPPIPTVRRPAEQIPRRGTACLRWPAALGLVSRLLSHTRHRLPGLRAPTSAPGDRSGRPAAWGRRVDNGEVRGKVEEAETQLQELHLWLLVSTLSFEAGSSRPADSTSASPSCARLRRSSSLSLLRARPTLLPSSRARPALTCGTRRPSSSRTSRSTSPRVTQASRVLPLADTSLEAGLTDALSCSTAGTNFTTKYATASYPAPVPDMPEFCRFGAYFHTSNISKVRARHPFPMPPPSLVSRSPCAGSQADSLVRLATRTPRRSSSRSSSRRLTRGLDGSPWWATVATQEALTTPTFGPQSRSVRGQTRYGARGRADLSLR